MLEIQDLHIRFHKAREGKEAVSGISLSMEEGDILGLVGESGSGKTVTAMAISGLMQRSESECTGRICFEGVDLLSCDREALRRLQGSKIGVVFQEPMSSMNPVMRIGKQMEEPLRIHTTMTAKERRDRVLYVMEAVELPEPESVYQKYPHELSGGMLQRVMIGAALTTRPKLLLCDEPTTALDVTIQAQILQLLLRVNREFGIGILFISHDLHVVQKICSRVAVMHQGKLVEEGSAAEIFQNPRADYTKKLIRAIPTRRKRG